MYSLIATCQEQSENTLVLPFQGSLATEEKCTPVVNDNIYLLLMSYYANHLFKDLFLERAHRYNYINIKYIWYCLE